MKVPCPLPLQKAWSPAGYEVIEVGQERSPAGRGRPPHAEPGGKSQSSGPRAPSSPVGCRVIQVGEEKVPGRARGIAPIANPFPGLPRRSPAPVPAGLIAVGGLFLTMMLVMIAAALSPSPRITAYPDEVWNGGPVPGVNGHAVVKREVILPPGLKDLPVRALSEDSATAKENEAGCVAPGVTENFGTTVSFVRNPAEAARVAKSQDRLTFVLHVSGNFEDDRFT